MCMCYTVQWSNYRTNVTSLKIEKITKGRSSILMTRLLVVRWVRQHTMNVFWFNVFWVNVFWVNVFFGLTPIGPTNIFLNSTSIFSTSYDVNAYSTQLSYVPTTDDETRLKLYSFLPYFWPGPAVCEIFN